MSSFSHKRSYVYKHGRVFRRACAESGYQESRRERHRRVRSVCRCGSCDIYCLFCAFLKGVSMEDSEHFQASQTPKIPAAVRQRKASWQANFMKITMIVVFLAAKTR